MLTVIVGEKPERYKCERDVSVAKVATTETEVRKLTK